MKEYVLCHSREIRTFVTIKADNDEQALERAAELQRKGATDENRTWVSPDWFVQSEYEDNDQGQWDIRESQSEL